MGKGHRQASIVRGLSDSKRSNKTRRGLPAMSDAPMRRYDLIVAGGGVIGLSIALEAASRGWHVLVIETGRVGRGSSWAGAGILPAGAQAPALDPLEQLRSLSDRLHEEWAARLRAMTGIDTEYRRCGGLHIAISAAERATLAANRIWWREHGIAFERWTVNQIEAASPSLAQLAAAHPGAEYWYVPGEGRLRNPRHLAALAAACRRLGVEIMEQWSVSGWESSGRRIEAVRVENGLRNDTASQGDGPQVRTIPCERVCIASGAWAGPLLNELGIPTGILPVRGQMVLYRCPKKPFDLVIEEGHRYLVPRDDGRLLAGSCEEEVGFDASTTQEQIEAIRNWAEERMPMLQSMPVETTWAGLRPGSFDTYPYLGSLPPWENATIAAGHFRHGLHWSTGTAKLMVQWMAGEPTSIDLAPFSVQRGRTAGDSSTQRR